MPALPEPKFHPSISITNRRNVTLEMFLEPIGMEFWIEPNAVFWIVTESHGRNGIFELVWYDDQSFAVYASSEANVWVLRDGKLVFASNNSPLPPDLKKRAATPTEPETKYLHSMRISNPRDVALEMLLEPIGMNFWIESNTIFTVVTETYRLNSNLEVVWSEDQEFFVFTGSAMDEWVLKNDEVVFAGSDKPLPTLL